MHTVAAVIDEGALTFDFAIPCEVFGLDRSDIVDPWYEFLVVAAGQRRVRTQTGFIIEAADGLDALERADTIVVPGWSDPDVDPSAALKEALVAAHEGGARIASLCTGAFVLAAAGLLDGRRATTHWMYADRLHARYPEVDLDPDVLYVVDGRVMTSAGTAAGIDLCLHVVALDHGIDVAATVARRLVMPLFREGGQAQYVDTPIVSAVGNGLGTLLDWARARPRRGPLGRRPRAARRDEPADAHAQVQGFGRYASRRMASARASPARAAHARSDRRSDRARRAARGLRLGRDDARAVRDAAADIAPRVPPRLPRGLTQELISSDGSIATSPRRSSKWTCVPVHQPVQPAIPMRWRSHTTCPTRTTGRERWA